MRRRQRRDHAQRQATVKGFGKVEVVTRDRYALFRTTRIFADLTVMREALRVVVHLGRRVSKPYFIKIGPGGKRVSHVVLVRTAEELRTVNEPPPPADVGLTVTRQFGYLRILGVREGSPAARAL